MTDHDSSSHICHELHELLHKIGDTVDITVARGFFTFRGALTFADDGLAGLAAVQVNTSYGNTFNVGSAIVNLCAVTNIT